MLDVMSQPQSVTTKGENQSEMQNIFIHEVDHLNQCEFIFGHFIVVQRSELSFGHTRPIVDPKLILGIRITKPP